MWNQVSAEAILLIRTYAFFNRNIYVLCFLVSALAGVVAYQLYVDVSQMLGMPPVYLYILPFLTSHTVLPFMKAPYVRKLVNQMTVTDFVDRPPAPAFLCPSRIPLIC